MSNLKKKNFDQLTDLKFKDPCGRSTGRHQPQRIQSGDVGFATLRGSTRLGPSDVATNS